MEIINDSITNALLQLFKNKHYIPLYPFKTLVQSLLRDEASEGVSHQVIDYASIPAEEMHLQIKMVLFGDSTFVGTKHLVKLISASSVRELKQTAELMRSVFGNQTSHTKTGRIEANFIEVFHVNSGLSFSIVKPRQHRVEMFVEVIIKGTIDECINLFIRRILEDAHTTEASNDILTSRLSATIRGTTEEINVYSMRDKRQQVVNSLKAAVLDEGDICLECYVHTSKNLLSYRDPVTRSVETTEGFTLVKRWYKLSYRDESDPANPVVRCFARNPLESVAMGIFTNLKDADMYVKMLSEHLQRMKPRNAQTGKDKPDPAVAAGENATFMLNELVNSLCGAVVAQLEDGELSNAGESMLLILGLMTCQRTTLTHAMQQVKRITHSNTVHICAVRDTIHTLKASIVLLSQLVQQSPAVLNQLRGNALSDLEVTQISKITSIYGAFAPAVKQIRVMLLELVGSNGYSELQYLAPHLMNLLWQLFDPVTKAVPLLSPDVVNIKDKGIAGAVGVMKYCDNILHRLSSMLHMVELTAGTEVYISTIKQDLLSYKSFSRNASLGLSSLVGRKINNNATDGGFTVDGSFPISHTYQELPKCLSDLIGYAIERHGYALAHPKRISIGNYAELSWRPASISHMLKLQLVPEERKSAFSTHSSSGVGGGNSGAGKKSADHADRERMESNVEDGMEQLQHLWDFYALLGEYNVPRLGGVDFKTLVQQEWDRYDVPRFMCIEGAKLRYLTDIHVLRAFHEGIYDITTGPTQRALFPVLCKHLFKFPAFIALWNNVDHATIQDYVLQPARRDWIVHEKSSPPGSGLHIVKLRNVPENIKLFISGGVLGSDRVLSALGARVEKVFLHMWHLPPLFPTPPASRSGMQIKIFSGVSVATASHWCAPELHRLRAIQEKRQALRAAREKADNMVDQALLAPTTQQVEKKRLFANFLGGRQGPELVAVVDNAERSRRDSRANDTELLEDYLDYYASDEEDGIRSAHNSGHSGLHDASTYAKSGDDANSVTAGGCNLDCGVLHSRGEMELEVVVRISYETTAMLPQVQAAFGKEVSNCCRYMQETTDWKLTRVAVHRDGEKTADLGTKSETRTSSFTSAELGDANVNTATWQSMEEIASKYGTAVIEAGVLYPEADTILSQKELMAVFQKIIRRTSVAPPPINNINGTTMSGEIGAAGAANQYFSADFKDIKGSNSANTRGAGFGFSPPTGLFSNQREGSYDIGNEFTSPRPTNKRSASNQVPYTIDEDMADEQNKLLDPTYSDVDRICRDSFVRKLLLQQITQLADRQPRTGVNIIISGGDSAQKTATARERDVLQAVFCYVPCRIRFTLLAQLNPRMSWGVSVLKSARSTPGNPSSRANPNVPADRYSSIIGHQANPLTVGSDHAIARLVSSTLWLSTEAARTVWLCAKDGEAQCLYHEAHQRHRAYHRCMGQGQRCQAYEHVLVNGILTQNYRLVTSVNRAYNSIAFKFKRLIDCMDLCRTALLSDNTTYDINALGMTIARYIVLGFRYLLTSPQVAHLRGGCAYLLKGIKRIESLLQLAPIGISCATSQLPTRLGAPAQDASTQPNKPAKADNKSASSSAHPVVNVITPGTEQGLRMKVKADDANFEAGLSFGIQRAQVAGHLDARRVVPFDAPPPLTGASIGPPPGANAGPPRTNEGTVAAVSAGDKSKAGATSGGGAAAEGEIMFRRALAQPARIREVTTLLHELEGMSRALLLTLCEDMCANFPEIAEAVCQKTAAAVAKENIPAAVVSLGIQAKTNSGRGAEYAVPPMISSLDALEYVLGKDCSIEALVAYIHRAETAVNSALSDPEFALQIQNANSQRKFKISKSTALNVDSDRLLNLRKVVDISRDFSKDEQNAVKDIVFNAALPPAKKAVDPSAKFATAPTTNTGDALAADTSAVGAKGPIKHRSASMQFRAGADVIKLLIEGANIRKAFETNKSTTLPADAEGLLSVETEDDVRSVDELQPKTSATVTPSASLHKLHKVSSAVMALTKGKEGKGIASLLKKMNMQVSIPTAATDGAMAGVTMAASASTDSLTSSATNAAADGKKVGGLGNIHNLVDTMFRKRTASGDAAAKGDGAGTESEPSLSLAPSFASIATVSSIRTEADEFYRPPISFPLTRFHDEAVQQRRKAEAEALAAQQTLASLMPRGDTSTETAGDLSDEGGEDIMLTSMRPSGPIAVAAPAQQAVPPAVKVFAHAQRTGTEGQSMLHLLRACMDEADQDHSHGEAHAASRKLPGFGPYGSPFGSPLRPAPPTEPLIEQGGMLQRLRHVPKPDYQAPHVVYF